MLKFMRPGIWRFARNTRGNIALLFALAIIPILLGVGVAIDYGRALLVHERMANAADAAALAIGSWTGLTDAERKVKAQQFFDANYPSSTLGTVAALEVTFDGDDIKVEVSGSVPTTFMRLANIDSVDVGVSAIITMKQRKIELALVLDTTGSMDNNGKMTSMQDAADGMVDTLFGSSEVSPDVKIAVVPFSGAVNIGTDKLNSGWLDKDKYPSMSAIATEDFDFSSGQSVLTLYDDLTNRSWAGCVRERAEPYELTDDPPESGATLFTPYLAPDEPDTDSLAPDEPDPDRPDDAPEPGAMLLAPYLGPDEPDTYPDEPDTYPYYNDYLDDDDCGVSSGRGGGGGSSSDPSPETCQRYTGKYENATVSNRGYGPDDNCPSQAVTPLTDTQDQVVSALEELESRGSTVIPAGLLWGWRVLSSEEPFTEGAAYGDEDLIKAIILLTDGENDVGGGGDRTGHNGSYYNAFGYAAEGHLGDESGNEAEDELDAKTATVCSAIKAQGIRIYTIGFQIDDQNTKDMLQACATEPGMAYLSPTNAELAAIFDSIAKGLSDLRIAQ